MLDDQGRQFMVVSNSAHVIAIRRIAKDLAEKIGFDRKSCEEIVLVVSELASNITKYAESGLITLTPISEANRHGLMIEAQDNGPGFDQSEALIDGVSSKGTLGLGLGSVNRMMDEFDIYSEIDSNEGTRIICKRWRQDASVQPFSCPFECGVISRPKPGESMNGDTVVIKHAPNNILLIAVIDGVGHGISAHLAAQAAKNYVEDHYHNSLLDIFKGVERACRATRGVVMAIAMLNWESMELSFASVGNIEVRVLGAQEKFKFIVRRGILGKNAPNPVMTQNQWRRDYVLALHTDGLSTRWNYNDFITYWDKPAQLIAGQMLKTLEKNHDDATLVIVK